MTRSIMRPGVTTYAGLSTSFSRARTMRARVRRLAFVVAVASLGTVPAACGEPLPAGRAEQLTTPSELNSRIASAKPGQTILLSSGEYGPLLIREKHFGEPGITIRVQPGARAVFSQLAIAYSEGIQVEGVEVAVGDAKYGVAVTGSSRISLSNLTVRDGPTSLAMMLRDSRDITVADCHVHNVGLGINLLESERVKLLRNKFNDLQVDAIRGSASFVEIVGNRATNFYPKPGDHPDFIQLWGRKSGPSRSNLIKDNVFVRGGGGVVQGIFLEDNEDVHVVGNALLGTMYNGISLARVNRALVEENFLQSYKDMGTRIITRGKSADVMIRNNVASEIVAYNDGGMPNPGYKAERNKSIRPASVGDDSAMQVWLANRPGG